MEAIEKIQKTLDHIEMVQKYGYKLGLKLIAMGEVLEGRNLISNIQIHDNSKFSGIEFEHLFAGDPLLDEVIKHHNSINPHHPEYWGSIHKMPKLYIQEMICDCTARSAEFGTDVREWFRVKASKKYGYDLDSQVYKDICYYLDILLEKPFA